MSVQDINIISWNCRGLNSQLVKDMVRNISKSAKAKILCIQETKCSKWPVKGMNLLGTNSTEKWIVQDSVGASGGLAICWDSDLFQCMSTAQSQNWIWIQMRTVDSHTWFNIINVYSPHELIEKRLLWMELSQILAISQEELICLVGNFNSIRDSNERINCSFRRRDTQVFDAFIKNSNLQDLEMDNDNFTWFGPQGKCSKLDRFLVNCKWLESGQWSVKSHCRLSSDHNPIQLACKYQSWGPKPFKGFNWWLQEEVVLKELDAFWEKKRSEESNLNIKDLLKDVKKVFKSWNGKNKNCLQERMQSLTYKLDSFDKNGIWGPERDSVRKDLVDCFDKQTSMLKQKSRFKWIIQGDRNTKFYNQFIHKRKNRNKICKTWWNGKMHSEPSKVKNAFFKHFKGIYNQQKKDILSLGYLLCLVITLEEKIEMEKGFSLAEIEAALNSLGLDKAPGPDGFNMFYIRKFWPHIKN